MEEGDDDLNPLISPGIVLLGIFRSGLVIFIAAISLVIVLHRFRHILAGLVRQILQIIELGGKVEFREGSEGIVQIVQIGEQFGGGLLRLRVNVVDGAVYLGNPGTEAVDAFSETGQLGILAAGCQYDSGEKRRENDM